MTCMTLPLPRLVERKQGPLTLFTDDALFEATGIRMGFLERSGGASTGCYDSLNTSLAVGDDHDAVLENRRIVAETFTGNAGFPFIIPNQVHQTEVLVVEDTAPTTINAISVAAEKGADGVIVTTTGVGALLNFADCVPVVLAAPCGAFAVVHAGWRGVYASIVPIALGKLAAVSRTDPSAINIYIGAYIHRECFETGVDVHRDFRGKFGDDCAFDDDHIDLGKALKTDLRRNGADPARIADIDVCTVCNTDRFFSYRAADGTCGRHAAFGLRMEG